MQDLETKSLWSQVTGECISGTLEGKRLEQIPAMHTTFKEFQKLFPDGVLLRKPEKGDEGSPYKGYYADSTKLGVFGRVDNFTLLPAKSRVFGLRIGHSQIAIAEDYLAQNGFALIPNVSPPMVVSFDSETNTVAAFTTPKGGSMNIDNLGIEGHNLKLPNTNIMWQARTGKVVSGKVGDLEMVPVVTAYWFAWKSFFPETVVIH
jgi:hypothetical protein